MTKFHRISSIFLPLVLSYSVLASSVPPTQGITVEGNCSRRTVPDRGAVTLTADFLEKDVKSAIDQATAAYERVRSAVKKMDLKNLELETSEYSVREDKQWEKDHMVSKGFRARMGLRVTSASIQKLGEVTAIAAREGIRDAGALSTYLSKDKLKTEQMACLEEAAVHARAKADKLASALGAKIGGLIRLSEIGPDTQPEPLQVMSMKRTEMAASAQAPVIEAGQQEISVQIYATFSLR